MHDRRLAAVMLLAGLVLLAWSFVPGHGPQYTVFEETHLALPASDDHKITQVTYRPKAKPDTAARNLPPVELEEDQLADGTAAFELKGLRPGWYLVDVISTDQSGKTETASVDLQILDNQYGYIAALGALLAVLAAPVVMIRTTRLSYKKGAKSVPVTGWTFLLVESTGLSLARLQLILLFVPAVVAYLALSFPLHEFPHLPDSIWQLLGIGGATAALSTLIQPSGQQPPSNSPSPSSPVTPVPPEVQAAMANQAAAVQEVLTAPAPAPAQGANAAAAVATDELEPILVRPPVLSSLFDDGSGFGDISHYQSLVMCVGTAVVFLVSFFDDWTMPTIPDQILQLLGMSLAVYLGVKGIKVVKKPAQPQ